MYHAETLHRGGDALPALEVQMSDLIWLHYLKL